MKIDQQQHLQKKQQQQSNKANRLMYHPPTNFQYYYGGVNNYELHHQHKQQQNFLNTKHTINNTKVSYFERPEEQQQQQSQVNSHNKKLHRNLSVQYTHHPKHKQHQQQYFKYQTNNDYLASTLGFFDSTNSTFPHSSSSTETLRGVNNNRVQMNSNRTYYPNENAQPKGHIVKVRSNHATPDSAYATLTNSSTNVMGKTSYKNYKGATTSSSSYEVPSSNDSSINDVSSNFSLEKPSTYYFETMNRQQKQQQEYYYQQQQHRQQQQMEKEKLYNKINDKITKFHENSLIVQKCESEIIFDDESQGSSTQQPQYVTSKPPLPVYTQHHNDDNSYRVSNELMQNSLLNSTLNTCDFENMDTNELSDYIDKLRIQFRLNSNLYTNYENLSFLKETTSNNATTAPKQIPRRFFIKNNLVSNTIDAVTATSSNITNVTRDENIIQNTVQNNNVSDIYTENEEEDVTDEEEEEQEENDVNNDEDEDFNDATFINFTQSYELIDTFLDVNDIQHQRQQEQMLEEASSNQQFVDEESEEEPPQRTQPHNSHRSNSSNKPPKASILVKQFQNQQQRDYYCKKMQRLLQEDTLNEISDFNRNYD